MAEVTEALLKCTNFAALKHSTQRRKDPEGTPYINHPIGVAWLLSEAGVRDSAVLQAALLHDTLEDTETTEQELRDHFGDRITDIVLEVTDDKTLPKEERKRLQVVHGATSSNEAKLVKLADKLYNCTDLVRARPSGWSKERARQYLLWSKQVLDGGLRGVNSGLEKRLNDVIANNVDGDSL